MSLSILNEIEWNEHCSAGLTRFQPTPLSLAAAAATAAAIRERSAPPAYERRVAAASDTQA